MNESTPVGDCKASVRATEHGAWRVGESRVSLDSVVVAFDQGHSPEMIRAQYPALTLEEVYGAIAYYLGHREAVEEYLRRQDQVWAYWKARSEETPSPVLERLRALRRQQEADAGRAP